MLQRCPRGISGQNPAGTNLKCRRSAGRVCLFSLHFSCGTSLTSGTFCEGSGEGGWVFSGEKAQGSFRTKKDGKARTYEKRKRCGRFGRRRDELSQQQIPSSLHGGGKRDTLFSSSRT